MKKLQLFVLIICFTRLDVGAQPKIPQADKSSMDISYYPDNYPLLKVQEKPGGPLLARVIYSRPNKNGRAIFGDLIEFGKVWRLGANEATEIEFFQNVKIREGRIKKGRYTLYALPAADKWTFIFNKDTDTWGSFKYNPQKDVLRVDVPVEKHAGITETFAMLFDKNGEGFSLLVFWDDVKVSLPISL